MVSSQVLQQRLLVRSCSKSTMLLRPLCIDAACTLMSARSHIFLCFFLCFPLILLVTRLPSSSPPSPSPACRNIFRVVVAVLTPFTSGLFHTHCFFRFYSSFAFPALALVDMLSQIDLAGYIYCIEEGTCASISTHSIYLWMWRDMASIAINIFATTVSWFAWGQFGFCFNEIYMPRWEHRKLTTELNTMNINRRNVKRKLGDEDFVQW